MMKKYNTYIGLLLLSIGFVSCDTEDVYQEIIDPVAEEVALKPVEGLDFSNYVAVGASFTAGVTDGTLFKKGQENSFPNILASKFTMLAKDLEFKQPLMSDNIGGLLFGGNVIQESRFYFDGSGPARLPATPTTEGTTVLTGGFNNYGVPGAKSYHLVAAGYGNVAGVPVGLANPYFARMASSSSASVLGDAMAQKPTFFTLSEVGGNDVLQYALAGGTGVNQTGNPDPTTYMTADITDPTVFANVFNSMITTLTSGGAKGVVTTVPYITSLAHFTTVPYNPLDPNDEDTGEAFKAQIPTLNKVYGALNQIFTKLGETNRIVEFSATEANPVVIKDENLTDLSKTITTVLGDPSNTAFIEFVKSMGLPEQGAPLVAQLLGQQYGQSRPATADDLLVLPSSAIIAKVNMEAMKKLMDVSPLITQSLAGQFSAQGVTLPLADKWVLTPEEQKEIKDATDAYNITIKKAVEGNDNLALVDFSEILQQATTTGLPFDEYTLNTSLVTGGLISLDGVHLTARGYALMANKFLEAIDDKWGSNFTKATNGLAKAADYPALYPFSIK